MKNRNKKNTQKEEEKSKIGKRDDLHTSFAFQFFNSYFFFGVLNKILCVFFYQVEVGKRNNKKKNHTRVRTKAKKVITKNNNMCVHIAVLYKNYIMRKYKNKHRICIKKI